VLSRPVTDSRRGTARHTPTDSPDRTVGWYLYGVTRRGPLASAAVEGEPIELLDCADLVAVVKPLEVDEFRNDIIQNASRNSAALEAMVYAHNRVIAAIHARQEILPAKFGMVYSAPGDIRAAVRASRASLLANLERLSGCDEFAVHLYADVSIVRQRIADVDTAVQKLRRECALASPGRAFFVRQQLHSELEAATARILSALAEDAFDRLAPCASDASAGALAPAHIDGEAEILRASFLVRRADVAAFEAEIRFLGASEHLRCASSGPWPPYSFAARMEDPS
jgi:hypothetical protein